MLQLGYSIRAADESPVWTSIYAICAFYQRTDGSDRSIHILRSPAISKIDGLESQEGHKALEQVTLLLQIRKGFLHVKYKGILEAVIIHHLFPIVRSGNV